VGGKESGIQSPRVLVVDDDPALVELLKYTLQAAGYQTRSAYDGEAALTLLREQPVNLVILDLMMPGIDGYEVCRRIRQQSPVPILMLTARRKMAEQVRGLDRGADAYVTKPFEMAVLLAHVRALLRRGGGGHEGVRVGELVVEPAQRRAWCGEQEVQLTRLEYELLEYLVRRVGRVVGYEELLVAVWGYEDPGSSLAREAVQACARRLQRKLIGATSHPPRLVCVRGVGYRLEGATSDDVE